MACGREIILNLLFLYILRPTFSDDQKLAWEKAEEYCETNISGGRLASVHNAFDNNLIASWLPFLSGNPWIGAFRIGSLPFSWTDGTDFQNQYTNWASGQPTDRCAQVCQSTTSVGNGCQLGKWTTADCTSQAQFICEYGNWTEATTSRPHVPSCPNQWTLFNSTQGCYRTFKDAVSWDDALETCRTNGADLTSIHSDEENKFVGDLVTDNSYFERDVNTYIWIGMRDFKQHRQWAWTDETTVDYYHWAPGEPNNDGGNQFCVEFYGDSNDPNMKYHWDDNQCNGEKHSFFFVCKRAPTWN